MRNLQSTRIRREIQVREEYWPRTICADKIPHPKKEMNNPPQQKKTLRENVVGKVAGGGAIRLFAMNIGGEEHLRAPQMQRKDRRVNEGGFFAQKWKSGLCD